MSGKKAPPPFFSGHDRLGGQVPFFFYSGCEGKIIASRFSTLFPPVDLVDRHLFFPIDSDEIPLFSHGQKNGRVHLDCCPAPARETSLLCFSLSRLRRRSPSLLDTPFVFFGVEYFSRAQERRLLLFLPRQRLFSLYIRASYPLLFLSGRARSPSS